MNETLTFSLDVIITKVRSADDLFAKPFQFCSTITINGYEVPLDHPDVRLFQEGDPYYNGDGCYHVEFTLKRGTAIPRNAFLGKTFKSLTIPEGIKTIKEWAFSLCSFDCDLILPESVTDVQLNSFNGCKVNGKFRFPNGLLHLDSFPEEITPAMDEIILPKGLISFYADKVTTAHLHIPASLESFCILESGSNVGRFSIDYDNPHFVHMGDSVINITEERQKKAEQIEHVTKEEMIAAAFADLGLKFSFYNNVIRIIPDKHRCYFIRLKCNDLRAEIEQAKDIAMSLKDLEESLPKLKGRIHFIAKGHGIRAHRGLCLIRAHELVTVDFEANETDEFMPLATRFIQGLFEVGNRLKAKYGDLYLSFGRDEYYCI